MQDRRREDEQVAEDAAKVVNVGKEKDETDTAARRPRIAETKEKGHASSLLAPASVHGKAASTST